MDAGRWRGDGQLTRSSRRRRNKPRTAASPGVPTPGARPVPRIDHQHSAGGLIVRGDRILLISTQEGRRWQLPKGHLEAGETPEQAALREVREETGVTGSIVAPLPGVEYWFFDKGARIHKKVDYFLLDYVSGDPANFDAREVSGAGWFSWEAGISRLTFENERRVVTRARDILVPASDPASEKTPEPALE